MFKKLFTAIFISTLTFMIVPACAEQDNATEAVTGTAQTTETQISTAEVEATEAVSGDEDLSVMDLPVNFSTPEDIEKSIEKVKQEAGDGKARALKNAMAYVLYYDLSLGNDKEKMYKKLNGSTPNEIIAKMKR